MHPYVHHVPGRLRIRAKQLRQFPDRAVCVQKALTQATALKPRIEEKADSLFGKAFFAVLAERALERRS